MRPPWKPLHYDTLLFPTDGSRDSHVAVLQLVPHALASGAAVVALEVIDIGLIQNPAFPREAIAWWV